jgi:acetyl-CoA acyltransferase
VEVPPSAGRAMTQAHVIGVGVHPFGRYPDTSMPDLARRSIWAAIADAGIDPHEVGVAYVANCYHGFFTGQSDSIAPIVVGHAGLSGLPMIHVEGGGAAGSVAFHEAVLAVQSGQYPVALAVGVEKLYVPNDPSISISAIATSGERSVATDMGMTWIGSLTMSAHALMRKYGWDQRDFALVTEKNWFNASQNPEAEHQEELGADEIMAARLVAYPLTRPMCASAAVDGAAAVLVANDEVAARVHDASDPRVEAMCLVGGRYLSNRVPDERPGMLSMDEAGRAFAGVYEKAALGPSDVDFAQVHDSIAPEELLAYQMLGLCEPGGESELIRSGATRIGGRIPVNTDGGLLARGHPIAASGVAQVVETVRQLRGQCGTRQIRLEDGSLPRRGAIQNAGAQGGPSGGVAVSAAILLVR